MPQRADGAQRSAGEAVDDALGGPIALFAFEFEKHGRHHDPDGKVGQTDANERPHAGVAADGRHLVLSPVQDWSIDSPGHDGDGERNDDKEQTTHRGGPVGKGRGSVLCNSL